MSQNDLFRSDDKPEKESTDIEESVNIQRISVLVPLPIDQCYTYGMDQDTMLAIGSYVRVAVGAKSVIGVVWDEPADERFAIKKIKMIGEVFDVPPLTKEHQIFVDRMARYTMSPRGSILKMTLNTPAGLEPPKAQTHYKLPFEARAATTQKREVIMDALRAHPTGVMRPKALSDAAKTSASTLKAMVQDGELEQIQVPESYPCLTPKLKCNDDVVLSDDQSAAAIRVVKAIKDDKFKPFVLDGVTGSGKTEVYFEALAAAIEKGQQVLILLPEIALSNVFLERFMERFVCAPAMWHSSVTQAQRRKTWRGVAEGQTKVVIGARSALFLPFQKLGLIIVDEEHDTAYKQEDGVLYHARDMAIMRCHIQQCPAMLVSATPALETVLNVNEKRYEHLVLSSRFGEAKLPQMHVVDMREAGIPRTQFISPTLRQALVDTVAKGQQGFLFLNRRGYAPLTLCRSCGHRYECPQCTAWLVMHMNKNGKGGRLQCHHCGFSSHLHNKCSSCDAEDSLVPCGPGVERLAEEVSQYFPSARYVVLASDSSAESDDLATSLEKIRTGAVDIVIGTQIMAKGHHFPNLTCVGVVDADLGLKGGDLRAGEHTWQLLQQVAGRAGRGEHEGHVYIQTYSPDSAFVEALADNDREQFTSMELRERKQADMPPFSRLAALILSCEEEQKLISFARYMAQHRPQTNDRIMSYGPAPAPLYMIRGRYRARFLLQAHKSENIQAYIRQWIDAVKSEQPSKLRLQVDIDPQSFM
jgi:primosomal protein N' (replication factor Y)